MLMNMGGFEVIMKIIVDEMPRCASECPCQEWNVVAIGFVVNIDLSVM